MNTASLAQPDEAGDARREAERLAALCLYDVLDTPPEPTFNEIARAASLVCKAPIALVSFVEADRQFFKAEVGLGRRETGRDVSICAHAIQQPRDLFVVPDTTLDPRFATNPLVTGEPRIRFYAGAPLETPEGLALGTLCVMDHVPRPDGLTPDQVETLRALARAVMAQLDLRRASRAMADNEGRLRAILDTMPQIVWSNRPDGHHDYFNRRWYEFTGSTPERSLGAGWNPTLHPDDRQRAFDIWARALATGEPYEIEYRLKPKDGDYRWFIGRALPVRDDQGRIERWFGTCTDVHDLKQAESAGARLAAIVTSSSDAIVSFDAEGGRIQSWNKAAEALFGYTAAEAVGATVNLLVAPEHLAPEEDGTGVFSRVMRDGQARLESVRRAKDGTLVEVAVSAARMDAPDGRVLGVSAIFHDITEAKQAEARLRESEERRRIAGEAAQIGVWDYEPATGVLRWDERTRALFGLSPEAAASYDVFLAGLHPDDREATDTAVQQALDPSGTGEYDIAFRTVGVKDGVLRWLAAKGRAYFEHGRAVRFIGTVLDTTARKKAEETLSRYGVLVESMTEGVSLSDEHGFIVYTNPAEDRMFGYGPGELLGQHVTVQNAYLPDENARRVAEVIAQLKAGGSWEGEWRNRRKDGTAFTTASRITAVALDGRAHWLCVQRDITDAKRAEEHQHLLINELNHRVKNTLTTVQSMAAQTFRGERDNEETRRGFEGRLFALARAHDVLTRENWEGAELREVVDEVLAPYHRDGQERFAIKGPTLRLAPRTALALAMALHELATNAAKYGALSVASGRVAIWWTVTPGRPRHLTLRWEEHGGPPVLPPTRKGFGSRMIQRSLSVELGGKVDLGYESSGVRCTIAAPIDADLPAPEEPWRKLATR